MRVKTWRLAIDNNSIVQEKCLILSYESKLLCSFNANILYDKANKIKQSFQLLNIVLPL